MDERADKLAKQLEQAEKTLFALEAYLAQARQVITLTRSVLKEAQSADDLARQPGGRSDL